MPNKVLERLLFVIVFIIVIFGVYISRTDLDYYVATYSREDGFLEWLTVLAFLVGLIMNVYRSRILKPFRERKFIFMLWFFVFLFFFGIAEEISWGQRIIGFETPAFFHKYNTQGEFSFHNLRFGGFKINRYIFGTFLGILIGIYFLIIPLFYRKTEWMKEKIDGLALPMPKIYHIIAYLALFVLVQMIPSGKKGELLEFGGSWIFLLMFFEPLNREIFSRKSFDR